MAPTSFGPYRVDAVLGRGGMGEVLKAFDTRLGRPVAVKVMSGASAERANAVQRFLREARAASALNHPNIVTIYDVGQAPDGAHYIVQELVDGRTLRTMLDAGLPVASAIEIGVQAARALSAAHAAGIVHRDVKPENIMVRADGYVKVLDFGLARVEDSHATTAATASNFDTAAGTVLGTTSYMSPEQARGGVAGPAADIFALGVVLYEMAAGRRPFIGPNNTAVLAAILSEQPVSMPRLKPDVPRPLDDLVREMLAKDPAVRPSASDVIAALTALQGAEQAAVLPAGVASARHTVGRDYERATLRRAYARARDGASLVVAVTGEPGIGKSSLTDDFLAELSASPDRPTIARGRCSERLAGADAYLPVFEALEHLLQRGSTTSLDGVMRAAAPTWYLQVATSSEHQSIADLRTETPVASQERMKRELGALFDDLSRSRPVVLFLEDLHWADVSTIDMLNYLSGRFTGMRLLVLVTYRPSEMALAQNRFPGVSADWRARGLFDELPLRFLSLADVELYLALEFPSHRFPAEFAALVHAKTEGSPLFMTDLVRYFRDSGGIVQDGGTWMLARSLADVGKDLPESVRSMIARKIDQLEDADRRLLVAASVQGHEFDSATLAAAAEMDPADVEDRLDVLERVHVFVKRGPEVEFPDRTLTVSYRFVHVLYQNALYATLQPTRRAQTSGRVARALVGHHGDRAMDIAAQLAVLFEAARDFASSARFYFAAAQHAIALFAFREAFALAGRGLDALRGLPDGPERIQLELGLQMIRGQALRLMKGWSTPEIEPVFARARELCHQLSDPPELFPVLWALTLFYAIRGDLREYKSRADELMVMAEQSGNPAFLMGAHHLVGVSREFLGDMVESARILERGRELHDPKQHLAYTAMYGLDPGMISRAMSSRPMFVLGYPDRAIARAQETLKLARSQRQPPTLAFAILVTQGVHLQRGEAAEAVALGDELIVLCREYELIQEREWSRSFQGAALALLGRLDEGIDLLKDSLAVQKEINSGLVRSAFLGVLGDLLRFAGRLDEGLASVEEGFAHAEKTLEGGYVAELHRTRGELLRAKGDAAGAERNFRQAIARASSQQAKTFELRAATALATLMAGDGRRADAHAVLAPVYGWFVEGHETSDLRNAKSVLGGLS